MGKEIYGFEGKTLDERRAAFLAYQQKMSGRKKNNPPQCSLLHTIADEEKAHADLLLSKAMVRKQMLSRS